MQKILAAFQLILQSFGRASPAIARPYRDNFLHDLALILQQDVPAIALDLIDSQQNVLLRYHVLFLPPKQPCLRDPAYGVEQPLLHPSLIASHRIVLGPLSRFDAYAHRLRDSWQPSPPRHTLTPNQFLSKYLQLLLNHRITARVFVSDLARRTGFIQEIALDARFAFAWCADLNAPVFLHPSECDQLTPFLIGQPVSLVLIHTPRGFQGRNIRPA